MNAHRVHVFDGANDDAVVRVVAHHFHLKFLPPQQRFFHEHLVHRRHINAARDDGFKLLFIIRDAAARPAERERRTDDERETPNLRRNDARFFQRMRNARLRHIEPDFDHRVLKGQPVLALVNRLGLRADHADVVFLQHAHLVQLHRAVQRRLPAQRGQERIGPLGGDDFFHHLRRDGLDVSPVRKLRVRHDGRRVRVHEDDRVALLFQRLASLHAGVVKFAALADDNRAGANEQDFLNSSVFRHGR